jgi:hypothetical protein
MKMGKSAITIALILAVLTAKPQAILAQATTDPIVGSWEGLKAVPPGDELVVMLRNGQTVRGSLSRVADTVLTLAQGKKAADANRTDVLRVHRVLIYETR